MGSSIPSLVRFGQLLDLVKISIFLKIEKANKSKFRLKYELFS